LPPVEVAAISSAIEDYSKAIYVLEDRQNGGPVATTSLAERLGVAPGSVSGMLKRMSDLELVTHEPYRGVRLTKAGERTALKVLRRHRLLELFLHERLGLSWDKLDHEADKLEHVLSDEVEALVAANLENPARDPHGDPIPAADLTVVEDCTKSLDELPAGSRARFVRVSDSDPAMLRYLHERQITLDSTIEILRSEPFGGSLRVRIEESAQEHALGPMLARAMRAEPFDSGKRVPRVG
jgi:DtxR family transcriptional regulator, Mn-dependent transcriptional regulator